MHSAEENCSCCIPAQDDQEQLYRGQHVRANAPPSSLRETGTQPELRLVTSIPACRQMPPTSDRNKKFLVFFYKTPMLIKAENSTKSDLLSFKSKMNRG